MLYLAMFATVSAALTSEYMCNQTSVPPGVPRFGGLIVGWIWFIAAVLWLVWWFI